MRRRGPSPACACLWCSSSSRGHSGTRRPLRPSRQRQREMMRVSSLAPICWPVSGRPCDVLSKIGEETAIALHTPVARRCKLTAPPASVSKVPPSICHAECHAMSVMQPAPSGEYHAVNAMREKVDHHTVAIDGPEGQLNSLVPRSCARRLSLHQQAITIAPRCPANRRQVGARVQTRCSQSRIR